MNCFSCGYSEYDEYRDEIARYGWFTFTEEGARVFNAEVEEWGSPDLLDIILEGARKPLCYYCAEELLERGWVYGVFDQETPTSESMRAVVTDVNSMEISLDLSVDDVLDRYNEERRMKALVCGNIVPVVSYGDSGDALSNWRELRAVPVGG